MDVVKQLLGRLHPLIVHLPIGFIVFGLLLQWYDRKKKEHNKVLPLVYFWAGISAVLACITGYLQYLGEGYAYDTVKWHLWSGIATALFSFLMCGKLKGTKRMRLLSKIPILVFSIFFLILISFTGHQGGNITHGEGFLIEPVPNSVKAILGHETFGEKTLSLNDENWQKALFYEDMVKPILNGKCISCHGPKKSRGELVLHTREGILKGGENGQIIVSENPMESALYTRLILPREDEDHMPPKDKVQLSKEEVELLRTWIAVGNPFDKAIGELNLPKDLFLPFFTQKIDNDHPKEEIAAAQNNSIQAVKETGVHVDPISKSSNYLNVTCINKPTFTDSDFEVLLPIAQQIAKLDLGGTQVTDAIFEKLLQLPHLTILKLDHTEITGKNMESLASLMHLKSVNLAGSKFEERYLKAFSNFKSLQKVYLYGTHVNLNGIHSLNNGKITVEYGDYGLPQIASDSIIY